MSDQQICKVAKDLESLLYPVEQLELMPGNYNQGDVAGVMKSFDRFGQRKSIVAKEHKEGRGVVLAGNTQLQAARRLGWTHIAVSWVTDEEGWDDSEAAAFAVTDNETGRRGEEDLSAKRDMLGEFEDNFELLDIAGFDIAELQEIDERISIEFDTVPEILGEDSANGLTPEGGDTPAIERKKPRPVIQASIIFETDEQKDIWYNFVRAIKRQYPETDTTAERIVQFIQENHSEE